MNFKQLIKEIQPGLKEQVITYLIYKYKQSWRYEILSYGVDEKEVLSNCIKKYDHRAFLLNGHDSMATYTQEDIRNTILETYNNVSSEVCNNCGDLFQVENDNYALYCETCSKIVSKETHKIINDLYPYETKI